MKVRIDMRFRGRMMTRQEVGREIMNNFIQEMAEIAIVETFIRRKYDVNCFGTKEKVIG